MSLSKLREIVKGREAQRAACSPWGHMTERMTNKNNWITLLHSRNYHNAVNQLHFNKLFFLKKQGFEYLVLANTIRTTVVWSYLCNLGTDFPCSELSCTFKKGRLISKPVFLGIFQRQPHCRSTRLRLLHTTHLPAGIILCLLAVQ